MYRGRLESKALQEQKWKETISQFWTIKTFPDNPNNETCLDVICLECKATYNKRIKKLFEACKIGRSGCGVCWKKYTSSEEYKSIMGSRSAPAGSEPRTRQSDTIKKITEKMTKEERENRYASHSKGIKFSKTRLERRKNQHIKAAKYGGLSQACIRTKAPRILLTDQIKKGVLTVEEAVKFAENYDKNERGTDIEKILSNLINVPRFDQMLKDIRLKPDFKVNEFLYVEAHGLLWHNDTTKTSTSHFDRRIKFEESGRQLLQFWSDEILLKGKIVASIINSYAGKNKTVDLTECKIITNMNDCEVNSFLKENHILGSIEGKNICLTMENKIVCCVVYSINRSSVRILRHCSALNIDINNGFSLLLQELEKISSINTITYTSNLRFDLVNYCNYGFEANEVTIGEQWSSNRVRYEEKSINKLSEKKKSKLFRIYDAGQRFFIKRIPKQDLVVLSQIY